jgi:hypothetical protein
MQISKDANDKQTYKSCKNFVCYKLQTLQKCKYEVILDKLR